MGEENEALITWFTGRNLPTGHFVFSAWESTNDVTNMVAHAIVGAHKGNKTSLAVLKRTKAKLESEPLL
jgi:hypothetical protein